MAHVTYFHSTKQKGENMKVLLTLILLPLSFNAFSKEIHCRFAGGYYANIVTKIEKEMIIVSAQQGYSFEISQELGLNNGYGFSRLLLSIPTSSCTSITDELIECSDKATPVSADYFGTKVTDLIGDVTFKIEKVAGSKEELAAFGVVLMINGVSESKVFSPYMIVDRFDNACVIVK